MSTSIGPGPAAGRGLGIKSKRNTFGCAGFREDARSVIVVATDEDNDACPTLGPEENISSELRNNSVFVAGLWSGSPSISARNDLVDLVRYTGTVVEGVEPLVFNWNDPYPLFEVLYPQFIGIYDLPYDALTLEARAAEGTAGDPLQFIDSIETYTGPGCDADIAEAHAS